MRKFYILGLVGLAALIIGLAWADQITLTTYYPAPYGVYREFTTTSNTYLAKQSGNVGIGTTAPGAKLHVDNIKLQGNTIFNEVDTLYLYGMNGRIQFNNPSDYTQGVHIFANLQSIQGFGPGGGYETLGLNPYGGNVGIGTANPLKPFQVRPAADKNFGVRNGINVGSAVVIEAVNDADTVNIPLEIRASTIYQFGTVIHSDARLKKNIHQVEGALGKVMHLNGVTWQWKDEKREQAEQMGVVAQDVEKVAPQLVREGDDGMKYLNYNGLNALTIEAIKELKAGNDSLKAQNMQLEARIKRLEAKLR